MREIKFRLWDKKYSMFDYNESPDIFISTNGEVYEREERTFAMTTYIEYEKRDHYAIMQYTGLKDKNGHEIYEGDILSLKHQKELYIVDDLRHFYWMDREYSDKYEIVGNIHENKELLEEE